MADIFHDCYGGQPDSPEASARALVALRPAARPRLIGTARWLGNCLVAPFGPQTGMKDRARGDPMQRFPALSEADLAFAADMLDRHRDVEVSSAKTADGGVKLSACVMPYNTFGRACLALVLPAHRIIMRRIAVELAQPIREER